MQNRRRRLQIVLILFSLVDTSLIKYGNCAPTKSQLDIESERFKRNAGFMNYLSSIIYKSSSFNYPDASWNHFYEPQSQPETDFGTNNIQYLDHFGNNGAVQNYISWPEHQDVKESSYYEAAPNDPPPVLTYIGNDDSVLENECGYGVNSLENEVNWNVPPQPHGIDESIFHNFYLIPGGRSDPTTTTTTTAKPDEEERTPNVRLFDCSSSPIQKNFLEKVLYGDNDEYVVLLIKRNPFLGTQEPKLKTEIALQKPIDSQTGLIQTEQSNENKNSFVIRGKVKDQTTEQVVSGLIGSAKQEVISDIPSSTVATPIKNPEEVISPNEEVIIVEDVIETDKDFKEVTITESSIAMIPTTAFTPVTISTAEVIKLSKAPILEENGFSTTTESPNDLSKSIVKLPIEDNIDIKIVNDSKIENNVSNDTLEEGINNFDNNLGMELLKENKLQTTEEIQNKDSENKQEENPPDILNPIVPIYKSGGISEEIPTTTISSQIDNVPLQAENDSERSPALDLSDSRDVQVNSESPQVLEDPSANTTIKEDLTPLNVPKLEEETTQSVDNTDLLDKEESNNIDSTASDNIVQNLATNPLDNLEENHVN